MEWLRRVARGRRTAIAEQLRGYEKILSRIEHAILRLLGLDEPFIAMEIRHVMRRQQHGIVVCGVQLAIGSIDDPCLGKSRAALRVEVGDHKLMARGLRKKQRRK